MRTSPRPAVLPATLLATLLVAGCSSAGESTDDAPPAAETMEAGDVDAPSEAADEPAPEPGGAPTAEFVATPPDTEVAIHVDQCSRPSDELSLDFSGQRTDGIVLDIEASAGTGTATASTPGSAGSEIAEESGPAQVTQQADGSLLVAWGEYELAIQNC